MEEKHSIAISVASDESQTTNSLNSIIFDLDNRLELLSSQADNTDILVSIASGILCSAFDILWVGDFSLERGRAFSNEKIDCFVEKTAKMLGCEDGDMHSYVKFLEDKFPIPSDGNTPDFGGGLQHHLRDFAHHPTIVGLAFSLLTQFTNKSYGTDVNGNFLIVDVPERSRIFIGEDTPQKLLYGTITWFFHLVSDIAGSSSSAGKSGGTGIPGPILSIAKELSTLPLFRDIKVGDKDISLFLSKLFNGTLLAKHDDNGKLINDSVIRFDLRGEMGVAEELGKQAIPVIANECIVRTFYFVRRLTTELKERRIRSISEMQQISWRDVLPANNPTIARMMTISTGVFTTVDIGASILSQKYWVSVNYVGVGRFAVAIGMDVAWCLKARKIKQIKQVYENIKRFAYMQEDDNIYERIGEGLINADKLGLTVEQTEILYNLEYYKVLNDIEQTKAPADNSTMKNLKKDWLDEWQKLMTDSFADFLQIEGIILHWYPLEELISLIEKNRPQETWFKLVLLETMLFEPYYPLKIEKDKKGNDIPSKEYSTLQLPLFGYKKGAGDSYIDSLFIGDYYSKGYIARLRSCYDKVLWELNEVLKMVMTTVSITAGVAILTVATVGAFAPAIAVALVGSNFAGLSGAALTSACLAYLGGGAIAIGGAGMAGGTIAIVGGGAALGLGVGAGIGGAVGAAGIAGKKETIRQSAKLLVSVREIFLNDEHDIAYSNSVYEQYVRNIADIEKGLVELRLKADVANKKDKKILQEQIKKAEESVDAMKIAMRSMKKFISSFEEGLENPNT